MRKITIPEITLTNIPKEKQTRSTVSSKSHAHLPSSLLYLILGITFIVEIVGSPLIFVLCKLSTLKALIAIETCGRFHRSSSSIDLMIYEFLSAH